MATLTPEQRELFRIAILRVLEANPTRFGLNETAIAMHAFRFGFQPDRPQTMQEIDYLRDKTFVEAVDKSVSPENRAWRITAAGRDYLAQLDA